MDYLDIARKAKAEFQKTRQDRTEINKPIDKGPIVAVLIDSPIVGPVWFAFNNNFHSGDNIPVFFAIARMERDELPVVKTTELAVRFLLANKGGKK